MKKAIVRIFGLAILAGAGWSGYHYYKQLPQRQELIPTAKVQRGDVVIRAYSRGELRAVRTQTLFAPNLFGTVQVTRLAPVGSLAKEKDLIVEYDDSERQSALEEARLAVESVDEQIKKTKADQAIQASQDAVTLLRTRYNVRRAELDVQRNPIIAEIDGKKNLLTLEQQKRALKELESDIQARQEQFESQLAVWQEQRNRSLIDVEREQQRIALTQTLAPITGLVAVKQNRAGNFNFGQQMPDIREGDTLQPGMPVADILDLSELEVWAKVGELDRANLREGQEATLQLDAIPEKRFNGRIKAMSGTATSDVFSGDPSKKFDVIFSLDMRQLLSGLGMKAADIERIMATAAANARKGETAVANPFAAPPAEAAPPANQPGGPPTPVVPPGVKSSAADPMAMLKRLSANVGGFTAEDRKNARMPLPPEQDSQVQVLLRPGLLADVEIQVEKLPDVVHVPAQAVFQKNGQYLVYVSKNGKFEPRPVQLVKQSESTMVIASGVAPGEVVALADPAPSPKKGGEKKAAGGGNSGGVSGMPGGK
jgi:HlyD family secretion protein